MAGKSTLMRQVALTSLMAQIGSFIPAQRALLPLFDRIFTRIGASDSLAEGLSTFMVEMTETAFLLKNATPQSLVILDEIGRGTSTYDGMSLAQAILEYLVTQVRAMTFFATHYHELTGLAGKYAQIQNAHMKVAEKAQGNSKEITFLYTLTRGPANKSYGIEVARLAGLPNQVTTLARKILENKENIQEQALPLFSFTEAPPVEEATQEANPVLERILKEIQGTSLTETTPLEALNKIASWQKNLQ
jgi:DNA mismatch repair protein MutS